MKKTIGICLLAIVITFPSFTSFSLNETSNWWTEIVDDEGVTGKYTSIDLDSNGYPHISYCREDNKGYVKYAYWNGADWNIYTIDEGLDDTYGNVLTTSIAIDSNDFPHIVYEKPHDIIKYAYWNGNSWEYTTVYEGQGILGSVGIALDSNDLPHVSYCDGIGSFFLRYAHVVDSKWVNEIVDNSKYSGFHNSISIDSDDGVHIAYSNINEKEIRYAYKDDLTLQWKLETVDNDIFDTPNYPAIDIDSQNRPHIGYYDAGVGYNYLKYAYKDSSSSNWAVETIISDKQVGFSYSLAISSQDDPYLMYQNIESKDLELIYWKETEWITEIIDFKGMVGCCSNIVLAPHEIPFISYRDEEFGNLKFAFKNISPKAPSIDGPLKEKIGKEIEYTFFSSDLNNHPIEYRIDWGDNTGELQIGPFPSGEAVNANHTWSEKGDYTIRVKAIDVYNAESEWSTLQVSMPKSKEFTHPFIRFFQNHPYLFPLIRILLRFLRLN